MIPIYLNYIAFFKINGIDYLTNVVILAGLAKVKP